MIVGIGTDIIEISRVVKACENINFLNRNFTMNEINLIQNDEKKSASNFAVKEAVSKVFGTGIRNFSLQDIEVLRDSFGKPYINLYGEAKNIARKLNINQFHVSISNTKELVIAYVIGEHIT